MRGACIDIGSNTTRLLVADVVDGALREVQTQRVFHRLRGGDRPIPPDMIGAVAATVAAQVALARASGAQAVCVVATAAIRGAVNGAALCAAVRAEAGVTVDVLSGEEEARLAFAGATRTLSRPPQGRVAVVDIGGGSSEIVIGSAGGGIEWARSFDIGSGVLADVHLHGDPPAPDQIDAARAHVAEVFAGLAVPPPVAGFAVGGSATSLRLLVGDLLDGPALAHAIEAVCAGPAEQVARRLGLHVERIRVLPAGMLLLAAATTVLGVTLQVSAGGLREGVLLERLGAHS